MHIAMVCIHLQIILYLNSGGVTLIRTSVLRVRSGRTMHVSWNLLCPHCMTATLLMLPNCATGLSQTTCQTKWLHTAATLHSEKCHFPGQLSKLFNIVDILLRILRGYSQELSVPPLCEQPCQHLAPIQSKTATKSFTLSETSCTNSRDGMCTFCDVFWNFFMWFLDSRSLKEV